VKRAIAIKPDVIPRDEWIAILYQLLPDGAALYQDAPRFPGLVPTLYQHYDDSVTPAVPTRREIVWEPPVGPVDLDALSAPPPPPPEEAKRRFLVMKECGHDYYQSWEMLRYGHAETLAEAARVERTWHAKYPRKPTLIIETIGAPFTTVAEPVEPSSWMAIPYREVEDGVGPGDDGTAGGGGESVPRDGVPQ
jgi:hypothetical protein